jgi:hypothetical protein
MMARTISKLHNPFFLNQGRRPTYFRHGGINDLAAAQDEVLWTRLVLRALESIQPRVEHFRRILQNLVWQIDTEGVIELEMDSELLKDTRNEFSVVHEACNQWLISFDCVDPIPKLRDMVEAGQNIVRAHDAHSNNHIDRERLIHVIDEEKEKAALQGTLEIQVRSLLCEAPDECKDVRVCGRLLDWQCSSWQSVEVDSAVG